MLIECWGIELSKNREISYEVTPIMVEAEVIKTI